MSQALSELNARFKYQTDKERYNKNEVWVLMELDDVMYGDCEDYALYLAKRLSGDSIVKMLWHLLTSKAVLHYVTTRSGAGHCILEWDGLLAENITKRWADKSELNKLYRFRSKYRLPSIIIKLILGKIFS